MYKLYATSENGEGFVERIGEFEDIEDIKIRVGHFAKDIVITLFYEEEGLDEKDY